VYSDHVSILKFIERSWGLQPLTHRSRDNFPNPISFGFNPYVPLNSPAIGDLLTCSTSIRATVAITATAATSN
jgi:phospholipase C